MSRCELCGDAVNAEAHICAACAGPASRERIQQLLKETLEYFAQQTTTHSPVDQIYFLVGNLQRFSGAYDAAIECYEKAVAADETRPHYHHMLATALAGKGDFYICAERMKVAVRMAPAYPDYHNDLGAALFKDGKYDEALEHFREAVRLNPKFANAHNNLALTYRKKKLYDEAEKEIQLAVQYDPLHAVAGYELGFSYFSGGMFSQLRGGGVPVTAKMLGDIYKMRRMYREAIEQYLKAADIHPGYPDIRYALAMTYLEIGDNEKAKTALEKAISINPKYQQAIDALAGLQ